jgi:hypothetical protein
MQQILANTNIKLIDYDNAVNFPSYFQNVNTPLLKKNDTIDILPSHNYSQGTTVLKDDSPLVLENLLYLYIISDSTFYYSINDSNYFIQTREFKYNNQIPLDQITLYNGNLHYDGYNFSVINDYYSKLEYFSIWVTNDG